ncbi:carbamoyl-phosphate synthase (glutamine-hydrolyzing) cpa2, variant 3 [Cadophora gregata f. sp. sojae]|nr:carbamoyl-phosphate synthase (glutamine-hydrolyzing) cpa2, variant 3 [Cadophora gregata f. sp. sojae]
MERMGIFERYGVKVLGTSIKTLETSEDRDLFAKALGEINIPIAQSIAVGTVDEALEAARGIGYPIIVRAAYALGGLGSGFANNEEELRNMSARSLTLSPQILVEKSLKGWKEVEYEVVRDASNNCITVCNMENFDPLGIHTGDSIVVAPSQTLSDEEYHMLRSAAIKIVRHLGVVGECNVQYALQPDGLDYRVIEVNARLSRSSALASKATGYPLAYTAAKIGLGHTLPELPNAVTKTTTANFEPSLDYVVTKIPRWDLAKFQHVKRDIGSAMKSVGEVMAIGRTFEESIQKAIRQVDPRFIGFQGDKFDDLDYELANPTDRRWLAVGQAMLHEGYTVERIHDLSKIDKWFLYKLQNIVDCTHELEDIGSLLGVNKELMMKAKKMGFSDRQIAKAVGSTEDEVRARRKNFGITPFVKKIDTLAAEFPADTNYLYTTYNATTHDVTFEDRGTIVLGSGVYRIGSSVEFDWCSTSCVLALREMGKKTVMINYNPETYSTDFDTADKLYFEELSYERVMDIYELENANGVVVSVGGQLPQNIALRLQEAGGAKILGTDPKDIDKAEDRQKFSEILDSIGVDQPAWKELTSVADAESFASSVGYPVLVRPSYVLSGAAMTVIRSKDDLKEKLEAASNVSPDHPVVITKFIEGAEEIDCDGVSHQGSLIVHAVSEHVEQAGVHSGDATLVLPPANLDNTTIDRVKDIAVKIAAAFKITGPFNMQIIKAEDPNGGLPQLKVIECNLRASRSFPFVSKVLGLNFISVATKALVGADVPAPVDLMAVKRDYLATKVPQFSWTRLAGADPFLGVEMSSTGEIACFGKDLVEAYWASLQSTMNFRMPEPGEGLLFGGDVSKAYLSNIVDYLSPLGYKLYAAEKEVKEFLESTAKNNVKVEIIEFPTEDKRALREVFQKYDIRGVFNLAQARGKTVLDVDYVMRRNAVDFGVPLFMEPKTAELFARCMSEKLPRKEGIPGEVRRWSDFIGGKPL